MEEPESEGEGESESESDANETETKLNETEQQEPLEEKLSAIEQNIETFLQQMNMLNH